MVMWGCSLSQGPLGQDGFVPGCASAGVSPAGVFDLVVDVGWVERAGAAGWSACAAHTGHKKAKNSSAAAGNRCMEGMATM